MLYSMKGWEAKPKTSLDGAIYWKVKGVMTRNTELLNEVSYYSTSGYIGDLARQ